MKSLNDYINESLLDNLDDLENASDNAIEMEIEKFLKNNYNINGQYTINNGVVDVNGSITVKNKKLAKLTNRMFEFGTIRYDFECSNCNKLKSLEGAPKEVGGSFSCCNCASLTSLEGAPKEVGDSFSCSNCNSLISLEGGPKEVGRDFGCSWCPKLKSLEGAPKEVDDDFECTGCKSLTSLKGAPKEVGGYFRCRDCGVQFTEEQVSAISKAKYIIT